MLASGDIRTRAWLLSLACLAGCAVGEGDEGNSSVFGTTFPTTYTTSMTMGEETSGDGDGDPMMTGDGDGDPMMTGDGDGDGDPMMTGDGDGDPMMTGDGDGDPIMTGDGDGDPMMTGDGDGDGMMMPQVWIEDFEEMAYPEGWTTGGNTMWTGEQNVVYEGMRSARSGTITHSEVSWAEVSVNYAEAGEIRFWYKVSSEDGYDYLQFEIDNQQQDEWSGELGWSQVIYQVGPGDHTFRWTYDKDISISEGDDRGWVDYVEFDVGTVNL